MIAFSHDGHLWHGLSQSKRSKRIDRAQYCEPIKGALPKTFVRCEVSKWTKNGLNTIGKKCLQEGLFGLTEQIAVPDEVLLPIWHMPMRRHVDGNTW
jgi:hypothetical protein